MLMFSRNPLSYLITCLGTLWSSWHEVNHACTHILRVPSTIRSDAFRMLLFQSVPNGAPWRRLPSRQHLAWPALHFSPHECAAVSVTHGSQVVCLLRVPLRHLSPGSAFYGVTFCGVRSYRDKEVLQIRAFKNIFSLQSQLLSIDQWHLILLLLLLLLLWFQFAFYWKVVK